MKTSISKKLILLLSLSLLPIFLFGFFSIYQIRYSALASTRNSNLQLTQQVSERIEDYFFHSLDILKTLSENLAQEDLKDWQKDKIILSYLNRFDRFKEIQRINENISEPKIENVVRDSDLSPTLNVKFPVQRYGKTLEVLQVKINLMQMWRWVDSIKIGEAGVINIYDQNQQLIASGNGDRKKLVFQTTEGKLKIPLEGLLSTEGVINHSTFWIGQKIRKLNWIVAMEEPLSQAYFLANKISLFLFISFLLVIVLFLSLAIWSGKREVINPIKRLIKGTQELAQANWDYQLEEEKNPEWNTLASSFNRMVKQIKEVTDKLILEERHSVFGRIASGLVHDLKHPVSILNSLIRNMSHLLEDEEGQSNLKRGVQRELSKMNHHLDQLRHLTKEQPYNPQPISLNIFLEDLVSSFKPSAEELEIDLILNVSSSELSIFGDSNSLNRVFSNLISNSLDILKSKNKKLENKPYDSDNSEHKKSFSIVKNKIEISFEQKENKIIICVNDTGPGIEADKLKSLFDEFITHRSQGLGLGLAICKKIVVQHKGKIWMESELGKGTQVFVELPFASRSENTANTNTDKPSKIHK